MSARWPGLALALLTACGDDPGAARATLSLERRVAADDGTSCFRPCTDSSAPPAAAPDRCEAPPASCDDLAGGVDVLRLALGYGDVTLADVDGFATVQARMIGDDTVLATRDLRPGDLVEGATELYFAAEFTAPARRVNALVFAADLPGGGVLHSGSAEVASPLVGLALAGCTGADCTRVAQVGRVAVTLSVSADVGASTGTISSFVDDALVGTPIDVPLAPVEGARRQGTHTFDVPAGTRWSLVGRVGTLDPHTADVALTPPAIGAHVQACPAPPTDCDLAAGQATSLLVTAPRDSTVTAASARVYVGGVLDGAAAPVPLEACGAASLCGVLPFNVPARAGQTWRALVTVGAYDVASETVRIAAP